MAVGALYRNRHESVNIQGETQAATSLQPKKSKHTEKAETENKQFLELHTTVGIPLCLPDQIRLWPPYLCVLSVCVV